MQGQGAARPPVDPTTEAKAIADVVEALKHLDATAIVRVLDWASKRYGAPVGSERAGRPAHETGPSERDVAERYGAIAELYTAAAPRTESESVLVAAYWHQVIDRTDHLDSQALNGDLKNLGHGVRNVTRACSVLIHQRPALMMQVKKAGATKQARKQYRLTAAGIQRVREMLAEREEADGAA